MLNKFEAVGIFGCIGIMAIALFIMNVQGMTHGDINKNDQSQEANVIGATDTEVLRKTIEDSVSNNGTVEKLVIDDVTLGVGKEVQTGDSVVVDYVGTLRGGEEFDNSKKRGEPFTFTVGEGRVIKGWDEGILGMKVGGTRILVIPANMAYGASKVGPIPANSTLIFSIELVSIK